MFFNAEHRQIPWLRELDPDPTVEIHPETADGLGISNGDWVWVENWLGKQKFKAKVTIVVPPEMVMAAHGWWFPEKEAADPSNFGRVGIKRESADPHGCSRERWTGSASEEPALQSLQGLSGR